MSSGNVAPQTLCPMCHSGCRVSPRGGGAGCRDLARTRVEETGGPRDREHTESCRWCRENEETGALGCGSQHPADVDDGLMSRRLSSAGASCAAGSPPSQMVPGLAASQSNRKLSRAGGGHLPMGFVTGSSAHRARLPSL